MQLNKRFARFAVAMGVVGVIASQLPYAGGIAMAQDDDPCVGFSTGGSGSGAITALVVGLVGIGVYSTLSDRNTPLPPPPTDGGAGTANIAVAAPAALLADLLPPATDPNLGTFSSLADGAGMKNTLKEPGPYTIFAPTNAAFAALSPNTLTNLQQPENAAKLKTLLQYHIVTGKYTMQQLRDLADGTQLPTLQGNPVTITKQGTNVLVNGAQVVDTDIPASNGIIHPLSAVLTAPEATTPTPVPAPASSAPGGDAAPAASTSN